ncbi:ABATE domain-containing protein [Kitasatospora sp. NBC_01287]|uniref:CGNR zinc finger domain-containing protein n=1 Tax=Kitasatospora sp. NBC_01287 TaxID=2903573 RepID=UPI00225B8B67|nr:ABATE domain-containing protein [Kitasatospora sp. NBC_01287]MCX4744804.1 ABATE domain-containing protein [Kitasatospora sp. NBC_01287]
MCLDFIRTLRHRGSADAADVVEELADPASLAAWVRQFWPHVGEPPAQVAVGQVESAQVESARALREAVHQLILAARSERGAAACDPTSAELLNQAAAHPVPAPRLDTSGQLHWHAADPVTATLALIARDALDLATTPAATRIRACAGPHCDALFLDNSRPGSRRWCSMDTCGNPAKKTALKTALKTAHHDKTAAPTA